MLDYVVAHEFGHHLEWKIGASPMHMPIAPYVSNYAETNAHELFAEVFAMYFCGTDSDYINTFGRIIEDKYNSC